MSNAGPSGKASVRRAFVAVEPPPVVLDVFESLVDALRSGDDGLRWTTREQWHVTLQFLGRVADVDAVAEAVRREVREVARATVRLGGGGAFPKPSSASVLWLGVGEGVEVVRQLAGAVATATVPLGFAADDRRFRPHVTLARARKRRDVRRVIDEIGSAPVGPEWTVGEVVLFDSETRSDGARYTAVSRMPVGSLGRSAS